MANKKLWESTLQNAAGATSDGVWVDVGGLRRITIDVIISNTATAQVMGSCAPTIPANNVDGRKIGSDISASALVEVTAKIKWLKVKVSAWTSGTVTAYAVGDSTAYGI